MSRNWLKRNQTREEGGPSVSATAFDNRIESNAQQMLEQGRQIFRYDTFGDEAYWTDKLKLHRAIEGSKFGGVAPGVSAKTALNVGLKVDMDAFARQRFAHLRAITG